jgi:hypothetical protein
VPKKPRPKRNRPLSLEEKLGHVWAAVFLAIVVALLITLLGKALLFPG